MTFEQIQAWCRANGADVRGIVRGKEFFIRRDDKRMAGSLPSVANVFHWGLQVGDKHDCTSPSDMERLVTGKMTLDAFKGTRRGG